MKAVVVGGSGYIGGEAVRLLLGHPGFDLAQVTSNRYAGRPLHAAHPNLRAQTDLMFVTEAELKPCDAVVLAMPHGAAGRTIERWSGLADVVVDLSGDFRLRTPEERERYYPGSADVAEHWYSRFEPGLPELNRERLAGATHVAVPGCMATAAILALHPLTAAGLLQGEAVVDARTGSSGGGAVPDESSHHPERSGALRVYKPHGHRHVAEIVQACGVPVRMTVTAVEAVRGVQIVCHLALAEPASEREIWALYREAYAAEPFVRLVRERSSLRALPEPKILSGTNYCDLGLALDPGGRRLVVVAALDNLMKGGAGNGVQCLNIVFGRDERDGLGFGGLHPV